MLRLASVCVRMMGHWRLICLRPCLRKWLAPLACCSRSLRAARRPAVRTPSGTGDRDYLAAYGLSHDVARPSAGRKGPCIVDGDLLTCASLGVHREKACLLRTPVVAAVTAIWLSRYRAREDCLCCCRSRRRRLNGWTAGSLGRFGVLVDAQRCCAKTCPLPGVALVVAFAT